ncbi:FAD-dependent oxidoreductase domain-containing protein 2-like [Saccoglossus kowalevskii]|uniref:FAD-dependent oxidoreductase domain-containing protein 2-like n=1 Tax=Saccoglossus kowalevskii TaxID=10224 RepID=A0ABM0MLS1_SACKO|nr:PREDICTED: FAD-dependent oxidoreductase domain-containing protein 2-like [Saccoglossus kowalevskii]
MDKTDYEYLVIGGGPAGLQMAYFLEKANKDYIVLERDGGVGSFFVRYPRHRKLISINKKFNYFPEKEYNLRHDWNSLLSDEEDLLFTNYTSELFPNADLLVKYMRDYAKKFNLNIRLNTTVTNIHRDPILKGKYRSLYTITEQNGMKYTCKVLLMATGAAMPDKPKIEGAELCDTYQKHSLDKKLYENKKVLILGGGNSAFEVADHISDSAALIHMCTRTPVIFSWDSHFVGDLRAVNNNILDMYHLKSLHALRQCDTKQFVKEEDGRFTQTFEMELPHWNPPGTATFTSKGYDSVILATGWKFINIDMFDESCKPETHTDGKFIVLDEHWETTVPDMFFIGTAMQSRDHKAASGFIHGFRYNIRTLFHMMDMRYDGGDLAKKIFPSIDATELANFMTHHVSISSALYQLGQGFLCDVLVLKPEEAAKSDCSEQMAGVAEYYYELPQAWVLKNDYFMNQAHMIIITIEDSHHMFPSTSATEFFKPGDMNPRDCKCTAFPQGVFYSYRCGKLEEVVHIGGSLVVRADKKIFVGDTNPDRFTNKLKNLFNRQIGIGSGDHYERLFPPEEWEKVYRPWTEEEVEMRKMKEIAMKSRKFECKLGILD